jgi:4'-phosphopantetheinyl transferase EntD
MITVLIDRVLPQAAVGVEVFGDDERPIYRAEERLVAGAVGKRRREFVTGRVCAHRALAALGLPPSPVLSGARGEPLWPPGVVGTITHCEGYRACAVALEAEVSSLGIDAEPHLPLPAGVLAAISSREDRERLRETFAGDRAGHWDRLLFCVKEAVYKAWYPRTGIPLGFADAAIEFDPAEHRFSATVNRPVRGAWPKLEATFSGRWSVDRGLVIVSARRRSGHHRLTSTS